MNKLIFMEFDVVDGTKICLVLQHILYFKPLNNGTVVKLITGEEIFLSEDYDALKNKISADNHMDEAEFWD